MPNTGTRIIVFVFLMQLLVVPYLGIPNVGKIIFFSLFVLIEFYFLLKRGSSLCVPLVFPLICLFWLFFLPASIGSTNSLIFLSFGIISLFFLLLILNAAEQQASIFETTIRALMISGVLFSVLGLYQFFHFLSFGPSTDALIPYLLPPNREVRIGGPYGQPNHFAAFLVSSLISFFYYHVHILKAEPKLFVFRFLPAGLVALVFFLTLSRGGLLSFLLVFGILFWMVARGRYFSGAGDKARKKEIIKLFACMAVSFLIFKILVLYFPDVPKRTFAPSGHSEDGRFVFWLSAIMIFSASPWFGIGLDNFKHHLLSYAPKAKETLGFVPFEAIKFTNWAHNEFLQILCEGGIFPFIIIIFLFFLFFLKLWKTIIFFDIENSGNRLYGFILIVPLIIVGMFEWILRNPPLYILFIFLVGLNLSFFQHKYVLVSKKFKTSLKFLFILSLLLISNLTYHEIKLQVFLKSISSDNNLNGSFDMFRELSKNPYTRYTVLDQGLPYFVNKALTDPDIEMSKKVIPYLEHISEKRGRLKDWFPLALIYGKVGREEEASIAVQRAINVKPTFEPAWQFQHYINVMEASRATGRPLDTFYLNVPGGHAAVRKYFYGGN